MLMTNNKQSYFNRTALIHMLFLIVLYVVFDIFIIDYSSDENAFSKGFYSKFVLCVFYLIGSKEKPILPEEDKSIDAAFHFSVFWFSLWMGISSLIMNNVTISVFVGGFLVIGGLSAFNLIDEMLKVAKLKISDNPTGLLLITSTLRVFLLLVFCMAGFFLFTGEWQWIIKPFYEW